MFKPSVFPVRDGILIEDVDILKNFIFFPIRFSYW